MAKHAHLRMAGGKEPRQHMWEAIRDKRASFCAESIAKRSGQDPLAVESYLLSLAKAKVIRFIDGTSRKRGKYCLSIDEGVDHPRLNIDGERTKSCHAIENVWRSLRILKGDLTAAELATAASVGGARISAGAVARYLVGLSEAGYVIQTKGVTGRPSTFSLIPTRYTGPRHPVVQRNDSVQVYDPNLDEVVYARTSGCEGDPVELTWLRLENKRLRELLGEWLQEKDGNGASRSLVERTQLEMIPMPRSAMQ